MPDFHSSKDQDKIRADCHIKSVIEDKSKCQRAFPYPVLCFPSGHKKVDSTAIPRVLRQATVQNLQICDSIVDVWVILVSRRGPEGTT